MTDYRFEREARTPYSEAYTIDDGDSALGRVDIHYTASAAYATLSVHTSLDEDGVQALIAAIDERIVTTADPYREDFIVTVWRGEEFGVFADESDMDDDEEMDDDEDDDR